MPKERSLGELCLGDCCHEAKVFLQQRVSELCCRGLNTAMEAEGLEELGYSGPDFPEELDEFLAYCVREHDGDFEVLGL